jgi:aspartate 1-decarboxylase
VSREEVSHNDELFIINGERYEAQTYCFNMEEGDKVIFLEGSAYGACATATLLNLRTKNECRVWCE